jgi:iduronate 2-sulfatase
MRSGFLSPIGLLSLAFCGTSAIEAHAAPGPGPNVVFVISDDLACDLACYGHPRVKSPNIDRLAARGVRFDRAYVQYTVCNPSRTSFLTGLRPETTGMVENGVPFRSRLPDAVTLPQFFRARGYFTAGLGKVFHRGLSPDDIQAARDDPRSWDHTFYGRTTATGLRGEGRNLTGGVLTWCNWLAAEGTDEDQPDGQIAAEAVRLLEQHSRGDRPFFLAVGFHSPHDPFHSPKRYFDLYRLDAMQPPRAPADRSTPPLFALPRNKDRQAFEKFSDADRREFLRAYYAGVSFMDAQLGKVLDALDRLKLAERTIVVFVGDHGYELGVRDWWNKSTLFERSCRSPLIIAAPGMKGSGRTALGLAEFVDLYPTLADLCGFEPPSSLAGVSLRPILDDPSRPGKDAAFTMIVRGAVKGLTVRTESSRYTEWDAGRGGIELYDHDQDPGEWHNLADDPARADLRASLAARLDEFRKRFPRRP